LSSKHLVWGTLSQQPWETPSDWPTGPPVTSTTPFPVTLYCTHSACPIWGDSLRDTCHFLGLEHLSLPSMARKNYCQSRASCPLGTLGPPCQMGDHFLHVPVEALGKPNSNFSEQRRPRMPEARTPEAGPLSHRSTAQCACRMKSPSPPFLATLNPPSEGKRNG
jgi:hypothetical protein